MGVFQHHIICWITSHGKGAQRQDEYHGARLRHRPVNKQWEYGCFGHEGRCIDLGSEISQCSTPNRMQVCAGLQYSRHVEHLWGVQQYPLNIKIIKIQLERFHLMNMHVRGSSPRMVVWLLTSSLVSNSCSCCSWSLLVVALHRSRTSAKPGSDYCPLWGSKTKQLPLLSVGTNTTKIIVKGQGYTAYCRGVRNACTITGAAVVVRTYDTYTVTCHTRHINLTIA